MSSETNKSAALTRRQFGKKTAAAAALTGAAAAVTAMPGGGAQAAPKSGGHMKLAMSHGSTSDTIDPATIANGHQWAMVYAVASTLTEIGPDDKLYPAMAESWDSADGAKTWTFNLRKGVEFGNGKSVTADDIVTNLRYHTKETSKSTAKPIVSQIESMKADGKNRVVINLKAGNADFAFSLAQASLAIFPAAGDDDIDWKSADGAGGYKLETYEPGVKAVFSKRPNYWKEGRAHADSVELLSITDSAARTNALLTGEVHAVDQVDLKTIERLKRVDGITVEQTAGPLHYEFSMRYDLEPFKDVNVRRALKNAVDREAILNKVLQGYGTVGNDHPIGPTYPYYAADLEQTPYDPDRAKWHLKQSGLSSLSLDLSCAEAAFGGAVDAATLYAESAKPAGININIAREPNDGYWSNVWGKKDWVTSYWGGYTTPDEMFTTGYAPGASWNTYGWGAEQERFQFLMAQARAETDAALRAEIYFEMQKILRDDGPTVIPAFANAVFARRDDIEHDEQISGIRAFDGRLIIERWWMA